MIGEGYWTTGVVIEEVFPGEWKVYLDYYDGGFAESWSTEGRLRLRYLERDVEQAVRVLLDDAKRLGIRVGVNDESPAVVYYKGDGEDEDGTRARGIGHRRKANEVALSVGLEQAYERERIRDTLLGNVSKAGASRPGRNDAP